VVVVGHQASQSDRENQQRGGCANVLACRNGDNQSRRKQAESELPGPEHQIEMILPADVAPEGDCDLQSEQKFDHKQQTKKAVAHF